MDGGEGEPPSAACIVLNVSSPSRSRRVVASGPYSVPLGGRHRLGGGRLAEFVRTLWGGSPLVDT